MILITTTYRDWKFLRRLHNPVVPTHTPDWRKDPVGFKTAISLADIQVWTYERLGDESLLSHYRQRYRDDPGTCIRYINCLRPMRSENPTATIKEAKRLFPDAEFWDFVAREID